VTNIGGGLRFKSFFFLGFELEILLSLEGRTAELKKHKKYKIERVLYLDFAFFERELEEETDSRGELTNITYKSIKRRPQTVLVKVSAV